MNFLELCKRLHLEAGYAGSGPSSVVNQQGEHKRLTVWIQEAWLDIQRMRTDWQFMRAEMSVPVLANQNSALTGHKVARVIEETVLLVLSDSSKRRLDYLAPDMFRVLKREQVDRPSLPIYYTIDKNNELHLFPTPTQDVTLIGEYYRQPVNLVENTDSPGMDERYHMAIVWLALTNVGAFDEAINAHQQGMVKFTNILNEMNRDQLPVIKVGCTLA